MFNNEIINKFPFESWSRILNEYHKMHNIDSSKSPYQYIILPKVLDYNGKEHTVIIIDSTRVNEISDLKACFNTKKCNKTGFAEGYMKYAKEYITLLKKEFGEKIENVTLVGFSLGGAVACIIYELLSVDSNIDCYSFGSPRFIRDKVIFEQWRDKKKKAPLCYINYFDVVTYLPIDSFHPFYAKRIIIKPPFSKILYSIIDIIPSLLFGVTRCIMYVAGIKFILKKALKWHSFKKYIEYLFKQSNEG